MVNNSKFHRFCSVIVPIASSQCEFSLLSSWLSKVRRLDIEVLLVCDSFDPSDREIFNEFVQFPFVRILKSGASNPGGTRNIGLDEARGHWIVFCDSDDFLLLDNFLEAILEAEEEDKTVTVGNFFKQIKGTHQLQPTPKELMDLLADPGLWRFAILKSRIDTTRFLDSRMGEDLYFLASLNLMNEEVYFSKNPVYIYTVGTAQQLSSNLSAKSELFLTLNALTNRQFDSKFSHALSILLYLGGLRHLSLKKRARILRVFFIGLSPSSASNIRMMITLLVIKFRHKKQLQQYTLLILSGGLGNQLFQYAFALANVESSMIRLDLVTGSLRKDDLGRIDLQELTLPYSFLVQDVDDSKIRQRSCNLALRLGYATTPSISFIPSKFLLLIVNAINSIFERRLIRVRSPKNLGWDSSFKKACPPETIYGYFQSPKYWNVKSIEALKELKPNDISETAGDLLKKASYERPIVLHIRRGDYLFEDTFGTLSATYYRRALQQLKDFGLRAPIWVFTDSEHHATELMNSLEVEFFLVPRVGMNSVETLEIMRNGCAYIIANSSFSWWAAFLKIDSSAPVFAPSPWFKAIESPSEILPRDWLVLPADFE